MRISLIYISWMSILTLYCLRVYGQCDSRVQPDDKQGKYRYLNRGSYCEGLVVKPASNTRITLIQYTQGDFEYKLATDTFLVFQTDYPESTVNLRITGAKTSSYYQLDGTLTDKDPISWDLRAVIIPFGINSSQIGAYGYVYPSSLAPSKVFIPLSITRSSVKKDESSKNVIFRSSKKLEDVKWRLSLENKVIVDWTSVDKGGLSFFSPEHPIKINILESSKMIPGNYEVEIAYKIAGGRNYEVKAFLLRFD